MNLQRLIDSYARSRLGLRPRTVEQLRVTVNRLETWAGRSLSSQDFSQSLILDFLGSYLSSHAASTTNSKRRALLTLWRFAYRQGAIPLAPPDAADLPRAREPRRIPEAWTVEEVGRLISVARLLPGHIGKIPRRFFWPAIYLLVYDTSCRIGAMMTVGCDDCNLHNRWLLVRAEATKNRADGFYFFSDQTAKALSAIHVPGRRFLFPWPYCERYLFAECRKIVVCAGLPASTNGLNLFHKLRRTSLSYYARESLSLAQKQAGHADSRTTLRHYVDPRIARGQSTVDVLPRPSIES